jgi:hypothetical protein
MVERIIRLETEMKELMGNGQPGRIQKIETRQDTHSKLIYIGFGILCALQFAAANGWLKIH